MRDGRKWKSIPFIVISDQPYHFGYPDEIRKLNVTIIHPYSVPAGNDFAGKGYRRRLPQMHS